MSAGSSDSADGHVSTLPAPLPIAARAIFVNRVAERAMLDAAWAKASAGDVGAVLVSGESGIGKSGLVAQAALHAHESGATVLYGRCDEDLGLPYQPFVEAIETYARAAAGSILAGQTSHGVALLARLVPTLEATLSLPPPTEDAEIERLLLFDAVARLFADAARRNPVLFVVEDLQWASPPTLLLLRHLIRSAEPAGLLVLGTYRDTDLDRDNAVTAMLADLRATPGVQRLALSGLDEAAVTELVSSVTDLDVADPELLAKSLHARTDGNPLWVSELLLHPDVADIERSVAGDYLTAGSLPEGVREAVSRRVARLGEETTRVLSAASIVGREFSLEILERIPELVADPEKVLDSVEEALAAKIVVEGAGPPGVYQFTHSLLREAIYADLSTARRIRLHQRVADALESLPDRPGRLEALAHHALEGAAAGEATTRAARFALLAGARAGAMLAYEGALPLYARALVVLDSDSQADTALRCDVLIAMAEAQSWSGQRDAARATIDRAAAVARSLEDPIRLARAALHQGPLSFYAVLSDLDQARLLEEALESLGDKDAHLRALVQARLALHLAYSPERDRATELSRAALHLARHAKDPVALCYALSARLDTFALLEGPDERLALALELAQLGERIRDDGITMHGHLSVIRECLQSGDGVGMRRAIERCQALAAASRHPVSLSSANMADALIALFEGRLEEGERLANDALAQREPYHELAFSLYGALMVWTWWQQDRLAELAPTMLEIIADAPAEFAAVRATLALVHVETGRFDDARAELERLAAGRYAALSADQSWGICVAALASVCAALRDANRSADLYGLLLPMQGSVIAAGAPPCCFGPVDHYLGLLAATVGDQEQARTHFEHAIELANRLGAPTLRAATEAEYGAVLLESADPDQRAHATQLLESARRTAAACGLSRIVRRVDSYGAVRPAPSAD